MGEAWGQTWRGRQAGVRGALTGARRVSVLRRLGAGRGKVTAVCAQMHADRPFESVEVPAEVRARLEQGV